MKRSATATILFLLMLLLAAAAGFVFLLLGGFRLRDEARGIRTDNDSLRAEVAASELELSGVVATREATLSVLATAEHENVLLEGQLVDSQQTVDELSTRTTDLGAEAEDLRAELDEAQQASQDQRPVARIVTPEDGATLPIGQPVELVLVAADSAGLVSLVLEVDGKRYTEYPLGGETLYARTLTWDAPAEEGEHTFAVTTTNLNGVKSEPQEVAIQLQDTEARNTAIRAEVEANVIALRGLSLLSPITPTLLTRDELRDRLAAENAAGTTPEDARDSALELSAFDFIAPDYDLYGALLGLRSDGILGFYDPEAAEFVVVNDGALLDAPAQWTHVHEFVHALQDQHYDLDALTDDSVDSEARAAVRALAEGEAELVQYLYLTEGGYFSEDEVNAIVQDIEQSSAALPQDVPPILLSNLTFPYDSGSRFVDRLYRAGGFEAIDAAWANPPRSTEQIMHPDRYLAGDTPQLIALAPLTATLGAGWQQVAGDIMGEFFLREYLDQQLPATAAERAATGWGGDRYAVYWNEATGGLVLALHLVWDTATDAAEFADAYADYPRGLLGVEPQTEADGRTCWVRGEAICFLQAEGDSWIVRAPDVDTAGVVLAAVVG